MSSIFDKIRKDTRSANTHVRHGKEWLEQDNYDEAFRSLCKASHLLGARSRDVSPFLFMLATQADKMMEEGEFIIAERVVNAALNVSKGNERLSQKLDDVREKKDAYFGQYTKLRDGYAEKIMEACEASNPNHITLDSE